MSDVPIQLKHKLSTTCRTSTAIRFIRFAGIWRHCAEMYNNISNKYISYLSSVELNEIVHWKCVLWCLHPTSTSFYCAIYALQRGCKESPIIDRQSAAVNGESLPTRRTLKLITSSWLTCTVIRTSSYFLLLRSTLLYYIGPILHKARQGKVR